MLLLIALSVTTASLVAWHTPAGRVTRVQNTHFENETESATIDGPLRVDAKSAKAPSLPLDGGHSSIID